jgi:PleD family two-component response regulator
MELEVLLARPIRSKSALALLPLNALLRAIQGPAMTNTRKILIVDDDDELREALVEQLALHEEFEAIAVETGSKGVQAAKAGHVDLVIMDVGLPDVKPCAFFARMASRRRSSC